MRKIKQVIFLLCFLTFLILNIAPIFIFSQVKNLVDGIIAEGEYNNVFKIDQETIIIYSEILGDIVYFGLEAKVKGCVSIGFNPTNAMKDADMIICSFQNNEPKIYDQFSSGIFGPHEDDIKLGGTFDILAFAGKTDKDKNIFEFSRKLNTGDSKDKIIEKGKEIKLIWAYSNSMDIKSKHSKRGTINIIIK